MASRSAVWSGGFFLSLVFFPSMLEAFECTKLSACSCKTKDGKIMDLSALNSYSPFSATASDNWVYQYSPCQPFDCGGTQAAVCQTNLQDSYQTAGLLDTVKFEAAADGVTLTYTTSVRQSTVYLQCDPTALTPQYLPAGENPAGSLHYQLALTSKEVCPVSKGPPSGGGGGEGGLSVGDVLLIVFFVSLLVYMIAGVLFNVFYRHESGLNIIPNRGFWTSAPGLIKEGAGFSFAKLRGLVSKDSQYQQV